MITTVAYSTEALVRAGQGSRMLWALHRALLEEGVLPVTSAHCHLTAALTSDAELLDDFLAGVEVEPLTAEVIVAARALTASSASATPEERLLVELVSRRQAAVISSKVRSLVEVARRAEVPLVSWGI